MAKKSEAVVNLYDMAQTDPNKGYSGTENRQYLNAQGQIVPYNYEIFIITEYIPINPNTEYTLHGNFVNAAASAWCIYDAQKNYIQGEAINRRSEIHILTPANAAYIRFSPNAVSDGLASIVLNEGAEPLSPGDIIWHPCAVKRYASGGEQNNSSGTFTYKGLTLIKNRADIKATGTSTDIISSTDQFFKDNFSVLLEAGKTYTIFGQNTVVDDSYIDVRYRDSDDIITTIGYYELPNAVMITPSTDIYIYMGIGLSAGVQCSKGNFTANFYRRAGWHDTPVYVRENGVWVTEAIVSGTLPLTAVKTTGEDIFDYKIYGTSGGVGDNTINLCDGHFINGGGYWGASDRSTKRCQAVNLIAVEPLTTYTCAWTNNNLRYAIQQYGSTEKDLNINPCIKDSTWQTGTKANYSFTTEQNTHYIWVQFSSMGYAADVYPDDTKINLVAGSTAPAKYVPYGYEVDMSVSTANLLDCESGWQARLGGGTATGNNVTGTLTISAQYWFQKILEVKPNTTYTMHGISGSHTVTVGYGVVGVQNGALDLSDQIFWVYSSNLTRSFNTGARNEIAILLNCGTSAVGETSYTELQLEENDSFLGFVPYSSTTTPIYIGSSTLGEDEYVDYGSGKIYRMSGGILTPTDPPVPLPTLPTFSNTDTIINYEDIPAPSGVKIKYKRRW